MRQEGQKKGANTCKRKGNNCSVGSNRLRGRNDKMEEKSNTAWRGKMAIAEKESFLPNTGFIYF
jgi:hypothetical protein